MISQSRTAYARTGRRCIVLLVLERWSFIEVQKPEKNDARVCSLCREVIDNYEGQYQSLISVRRGQEKGRKYCGVPCCRAAYAPPI